MAVLKAVVTPQLGEIAGYGLIFGPGPILGNIRYVKKSTQIIAATFQVKGEREPEHQNIEEHTWDVLKEKQPKAQHRGRRAYCGSHKCTRIVGMHPYF